jgi:hypothetical protein
MPEKSVATDQLKLSDQEKSILETLIYFDIFNYPLRPSEIHLYAPSKMNEMDVVPSLNYLENHQLVQKQEGYYALNINEDKIKARESGKKAAERMMKHAKRFSNLISRFPFVRCVCISGSLSKGHIDEQGDVDYFIIAKPGRLWIARTLLIGFKKVFLLNSKKYFCVNYFIDTEHLEIPDKNIFTATEIRTLIPMFDGQVYSDFLATNEWANEFRPNLNRSTKTEIPAKKNYPVKSFIELCLAGRLGSALDTFCMNLTVQRWQRKFAYFSTEDFEQALRSRVYVSKHHPQNFQKRVLNAISKRQEEFEVKFGSILTSLHD